MIELALVKQHLRIDHDYDDVLLGSYIGAALSAFETFTNRALIAPDELAPSPSVRDIHFSKSIQQGALLLIGHWYSNRESVVIGATANSVPMATTALWMPHRWACI